MKMYSKASPRESEACLVLLYFLNFYHNRAQNWHLIRWKLKKICIVRKERNCKDPEYQELSCSRKLSCSVLMAGQCKPNCLPSRWNAGAEKKYDEKWWLHFPQLKMLFVFTLSCAASGIVSGHCLLDKMQILSKRRTWTECTQRDI